MNPIETPQPLPEKLGKQKLKDEEHSDEDSDSNDSVTSEEEDDDDDEYSYNGYSSDYNSTVSEEDDDDDSDSDDSLPSEDDEKDPDADLQATRLLLREQSKQIARDFLQQVQENRFSDFSWPPDPKCPEYDYVSHYIGDVVFEEDSEIARRYLDQVRKSWGYEVDCVPPQWMHPTLYPVDLKTCCFLPKQTKECVIESINAEAKGMMGKRFEVVRVNKIVRARKELYLLTLSIKDAETNTEYSVRAAVSMPPPCKDPIVVECKLVSSPA